MVTFMHFARFNQAFLLFDLFVVVFAFWIDAAQHDVDLFFLLIVFLADCALNSTALRLRAEQHKMQQC